MSDVFRVTANGSEHVRIHSLDDTCEACVPFWPKRCPECDTGFLHADPDLARVHGSGDGNLSLKFRCQACDVSGMV
jgi:hypothetical protein